MRRQHKHSSMPQGSRSEIIPVAMCPGPSHKPPRSAPASSSPRSYAVRRCMATGPCYPPPRRIDLPTPQPWSGSHPLGRPGRAISRKRATASIEATSDATHALLCCGQPRRARPTPCRCGRSWPLAPLLSTPRCRVPAARSAGTAVRKAVIRGRGGSGCGHVSVLGCRPGGVR